MKDIRDAINEFKADWPYREDDTMCMTSELNNSYDLHTIRRSHGVNVNDCHIHLCTYGEFNALVEEMTLGLDVNPVNLGHYLNYVDADKTLLKKESEVDYTSEEFWKDAPDDKGFALFNETRGLKEFFTKRPIKDNNDWASACWLNYDNETLHLRNFWKLIERPQLTPTETPEEKEALDSIINKPLVYTQEFRVKGGNNPRYQPCRVVYSGTKYTVVVNSDGREFSRKTSKLDIRDIDTRTKKEKAIDEIESELSKIAYSTRSALELAYDEWVGE